MPSFGNGRMLAPPRGALRGILSVERACPELYRILDRPRWVVAQCRHHAAPPQPTAGVDIYQCDPYYKTSLPVLPVLPRDMCDENIYKPLCLSPEYDLFYDACWHPVKRHRLLVDTLTYAAQRGRSIRTLVQGYHWHPDSGGTSTRLEQNFRSAVCSHKLDVTIAPTQWDCAENVRRYNLCRVVALFSRAEAGPRVQAHAALTGKPYICCSDCRGGSVQHLVPASGRAVAPQPQQLAAAIWDAIDNPCQYDPRPWAVSNMCLSHAEAIFRATFDKSCNLDGLCLGPELPIDWLDTCIKAQYC